MHYLRSVLKSSATHGQIYIYITFKFFFHRIQTQKDKDKFDKDNPPMVYACATMWHESRLEMKQLLKSLFRYYEFNRIVYNL